MCNSWKRACGVVLKPESYETAALVVEQRKDCDANTEAIQSLSDEADAPEAACGARTTLPKLSPSLAPGDSLSSCSLICSQGDQGGPSTVEARDLVTPAERALWS